MRRFRGSLRRSYLAGLFLAAFAAASPAAAQDRGLPAAESAATWIVPSAARVFGADYSWWLTTISLANPSSREMVVTLKFLGHDQDGTGGDEVRVGLRPGETSVHGDVLHTAFGILDGFGAVRITASPDLVVHVETSRFTNSPDATVGQALPAFGAADLIGSTPKTLVPVREHAGFRTNLVLANATEAPLTVRVVLYAGDGTQIGARDVDLPPLGMTQLSRVAALLGAPALGGGRIALSTPTPGGLFAAYASAINNFTSDPRTILPR